MSARWIVIISLAATASATPAQTPQPPAKRKPAATTRPTEPPHSLDDTDRESAGASTKPDPNAAVKALRRRVPDARFDEMPFENFVEWIGRESRVNVVVRWQVLEREGLERDVPITIKLKNTPVRQLLKLAFQQVTQDVPDVELAARAQGNVIVISTRADLNAKLVTRIYDVQDLLLHVPDFRGPPPKIGGTGRTDIDAGGGVRANTDEAATPAARSEQRVRNLIEMVTSTIEPSSWRANGGRGTIAHFRGTLVVYNTLEVHQAIAGAFGLDDADHAADRGPAGSKPIRP